MPKCLNERCRAPLACEGFGYCREHNAGDKITTPEMIEARRRKLMRANADSCGPCVAANDAQCSWPMCNC